MNMDEVRIKAPELWSDVRQYNGERAQYRYWNSKGTKLALKLVSIDDAVKFLEISESLENLDFAFGDAYIFEKQGFPFHPQYILEIKKKCGENYLSLHYVNRDALAHGSAAEAKLAEIFGYGSFSELKADLFKGSGLNL